MMTIDDRLDVLGPVRARGDTACIVGPVKKTQQQRNVEESSAFESATRH